MKYELTTAVYPMGKTDFPFVPGTERTQTLDSESGLGKTVWEGYLSMQKGKKPVLNADNFSTAMNSFFRFLAGEGRDSWPQVRNIREVA